MAGVRASTVATIITLLILILPIATAASSMGTFRIGGALLLPHESEVTLTQLSAAYLGDTANASFFMSAPEISLHWFERESVAVGGLVASQVIPTKETTWRLTNVTIEISAAGDHAGLVGLYPAPTAQAVFVGTANVDVESRQASQVPDDEAWSGDAPYQPYYVERVTGPHLRIESAGSLTYRGPGALKVQGMDLRINAAENTSEWVTGYSQPSPTVARFTWFYFEFDESEITISGTEPFQIAAAKSSIEWDGEARMRASSGELRSSDGIYSATGGAIMLDGAFTATLVPAATAQNAIDAQVSGELRATSLRYQAAPVGPRSGSTAVALVAIGIAVVVGGGTVAGVVVARQKWSSRSSIRSAPVFPNSEVDAAGASSTAMRYARLAEEAADAQMWDVAADLYGKAGRLAPAQAGDHFTEQAAALYALKDYALALSKFEEGARLSDDGVADMWAARCSMRLGQFDHAELSLLRALERPSVLPEVVRQIGSEDEFDIFRHRCDALREALEAASARLARSWDHPS